MRRVGVIGSGVAGLSALRSLRGKGIPCVAFERASNMGGVWRENYVGSGLQVRTEMYHFPDFDFPPPSGKQYATSEQVQAYVERFAKHFSLEENIQFNSPVSAAEQQADGSWLLTIEGRAEKERVDALIVATGMYGHPQMPPLLSALPPPGGQNKFAGKIMHSSQVVNGKDFEQKNVLIVGGGKSALDVALAVKEKLGAKSSTILSRSIHWMTPPKVLGLIPFEYIFLSRMGQLLVDLHKGAWPSAASAGKGDVKLAKAVMAPVFRVVEAILALQYGFSSKHRPKGDVAGDLYSCASIVDSSIVRGKQADGTITIKQGQIAQLGQNEVKLEDGTTLPCDVLVCATGFEKSYDLFDPISRAKLRVEDDGLYLYRKIVPPKFSDCTLFFCGSEAAFVYNICGSALQAEWIARVLAGEVKLPRAREMEDSVQASKSWARSWMPPGRARANQVMLHQIHAYDELLEDMGENPRRKSNALAEFFMPYLPRDYNGIIKDKV